MEKMFCLKGGGEGGGAGRSVGLALFVGAGGGGYERNKKEGITKNDVLHNLEKSTTDKGWDGMNIIFVFEKNRCTQSKQNKTNCWESRGC